MRKRYVGVVTSVSTLRKPIIKKLSPDDDCNIFEIEQKFIIKDIKEYGSENIITNTHEFMKTKKWCQVSKLIYDGNEITFEALFENGEFRNVTNICGENPYGTHWETKRRFKMPRSSETIGCLYCKHHDHEKDCHKSTCYKIDTWNK